MNLNNLLATALFLASFAIHATDINPEEIPNVVIKGLQADHPDARDIKGVLIQSNVTINVKTKVNSLSR